MLKNRSTTSVRVLIVWSVVLVGIFLLHPFFWDTLYSSRKNPVIRRLPKGAILERHGMPVATGDDRVYSLAAAGEPLIWAYMEGRLSEQLTTSTKKSKMLYLWGDDEGFDVKITLDSALQRMAAEVLKDCTGALIIMKTNGEILAMASSSGVPFNPNTMTRERFKTLQEDKRKPLVNRGETPYPPGSTFKVLVAAKLIEKGVPDKPYQCRGSIRVGHKDIPCKRAHGSVHLKEAMQYSCNGYFISKALSELSNDDLVSIFSVFSSWQIKKDFRENEKAFFTIGQGQNLLTPIEMATVAATIASKGMKPKAVFQKKDVTLTKVMDTKVAEQISGLMINTAEYGTARGLMGNKGQIIGGKTGTSEIETSEGIRNNAVLIGFAGRKKPEIAFALVVENTTGSSASEAVPRMKKVLDYYFKKVKL